MAYKWKPSKTARREFAMRMQNDNEYAAQYNARKEAKAEKMRNGSKFDYASAGGMYVPTQAQFEAAIKFLCDRNITNEQRSACEIVMAGFSLQEKVHHDSIHVVNELARNS